jgi:histone arginine demethylase JMJD6
MEYITKMNVMGDGARWDTCSVSPLSTHHNNKQGKSIDPQIAAMDDYTSPVLKNGQAIERAKLSIAPRAKLEDWLLSADNPSTIDNIDIHHDDGDGSSSVAIDGRVFRDNVLRIPGSFFEDDLHGDSLPDVPTVLTGLLEEWPAFSNPGVSWSVKDLAARTSATRVSLDGGPSFARMSMCTGRVTLSDYNHYCENGAADGDAAPLYVFDPDILKCTFNDGTSVQNDLHMPACFSNDTMGCIDGTQYRPLPPAWLLVSVLRSGTPIHDHPLTVAWNALLVGCKLWCCLPPDADESLLLLNLDDEDENGDGDGHDNDEESSTASNEEFDLSALQWFEQCDVELLFGAESTTRARIIVQRPGEVVFLPAGWFHVVLNVETSTAISTSLALRRDLPVVLPLLIKSDKEFAVFWLERLPMEVKEYLLRQAQSAQSQSPPNGVNVNTNDSSSQEEISSSMLLEWLEEKMHMLPNSCRVGNWSSFVNGD